MIRCSAALALTAIVLATGCASGASHEPVPPPPEAPKPGNLPAQILAVGECGLLLWTQTEPRRFIFFSKAGSGTAQAMLSETQQTLTQTRQGGTLFGQFMTDMDYASSEGESVSVIITPGERVENGQKISGGRINILNDGGWETLVPVVGLRACQQETE